MILSCDTCLTLSLPVFPLIIFPFLSSRSCRSLWVGNITLEVTEKDLWDLFKM